MGPNFKKNTLIRSLHSLKIRSYGEGGAER